MLLLKVVAGEEVGEEPPAINFAPQMPPFFIAAPRTDLR